MSYDTERINQDTDLLALVGEATSLRKVSGAEYAGPCPKCGGDDRFHVHAEAGWWFCRQCHEKRGDAIAYVRWLEGLGFKEACERLGAVVIEFSQPKAQVSRLQRQPALAAADAPSAAWRETAERFMAYAEGQLWQHPHALDYLRGRGLSDASIKAARLGYNPRTAFDRDLTRWGCREGRAVWLPKGWTIPNVRDGALWAVRVRRPNEDVERGDAKYVSLKGTRARLYNLGSCQGVGDGILTEGEFDALLLGQELGGVAGVVATCGASKHANAQDAPLLANLRRLWVATDTDRAGQAGASWWLENTSKARRLEPPGHDITDAWQAGHDLIAWALPVIGPQDTETRLGWLLHHLERLDGAALAAGDDEGVPALRQWRALYAELATLKGWAGK